MALLNQLSPDTLRQRFGRLVDRAGRRGLGWLLDRVLPEPPNVPLSELTGIRSVLLVRPNFRIGGMLMTTALVSALRERFPNARLEVLAGDKAASILAELSIDAVHTVSRFHILFPWRFVALFGRLRRAHFDAAIEPGTGSFSGTLYAYMSGARYRIGWNGRGDRFLNVRLPSVRVGHAYDTAPAFAHSLGASCSDRPVYRVGAAEDVEAMRILDELGLMQHGSSQPFLALFVGGHLDKRWPRSRWIALAQELERRQITFVVFLGPEEAALETPLRAGLSPRAIVVPPRPLRIFAAMLARARLLVTTDSGPMHLAVALGVPTIALLQTSESEFYRPRGAADRALVKPSVEMVVEAVTSFTEANERSSQTC